MPTLDALSVRLSYTLAAGILSVAFAACSSASDEATPVPKPTATKEDPTVPSKDPAASSGGTPSGSSSGGQSSGSSGGSVAGVPTEPAALNAWLQTKEYKTWAHESKPHPSTGPHGGSVQTYINDLLKVSLDSAGGEHAKGAAAVKEFYTGGQLSGWAVMVKTEDASENGLGWYWYEVFDTKPNASGAIEGQGNGTCTGCHSRGNDYFRAPYPLQ